MFKRAKVGQKSGTLFEIKISSTSRQEVLNFINDRLKTKEKFYIVTPNPEIVLMASRNWLLKKAIKHADLAVPDGIGLKFAFKFLYGRDIEIIKGRELFLDILKIADENYLKVYFVGGEKGEAMKAKEKLEKQFKNLKVQTNIKMPKLNKNGKPISKEDRKLQKSLLGSIKMFEPDLIFVGLGAPKQEEWIFRNFFRMNALGAMAVGGTFNYIAGFSKFPPKWMERVGLEWLWRLMHEPKRVIRIWNAVVAFSFKVLLAKFKRDLR